jgi:predicted nucleic acid-binding Zn ribbon protein
VPDDRPHPDRTHQRDDPPPGGEPADPALGRHTEPRGVPHVEPGEDAHDPTGTDLARTVAARVRARRRSWRRTRPAVPPQSSGALPGGRDPRLLSAALDGLVEEQGWQSDVSVHGVFGRWDQIVGAEVAAHCRPETFRDGELTISTDSTAWATQVRLLASTLVRRLNAELGQDTIARVVVRPPVAPSWRRGFRTVRGSRGPRDTYG